jgi:cellulose synthase/poly-beta-1,6-N-acetylglucosamine synthase-like glycosyltransferase
MVFLLVTVNHIILYYFILSSIAYTVLLASSFSAIVNFFKRTRYASNPTVLNSDIMPPLTIIMPIYNEEENIINSIESVLGSTYQNFYIILVNDASTDNTVKLLIDRFQLYEESIFIEQHIPATPIKATYISKTYTNILLIDKIRNGGGCGSDSINVGLNACFTPFFMTFDADSIMDPRALTEFMYEIMTQPNTIAVGGGVYILNGCKYRHGVIVDPRLPRKLVPSLQALEYFRSHVFSRTGWNLFGGCVAYSGTATLFDRRAVMGAGGFDATNFAYDVEMIMRLTAYVRKHKIPHKMRFNPAVTIWTDVPTDLKQFAKQRDKWRRGMLRSTSRYWYMFLNPKYGIQGLIGYPAYVLLELWAPIIEFTAYFSVITSYVLGILNLHDVLIFILLAWGFVSYITIANMFINLITFNRYNRASDIFRMFILAFIETFGFRQFSVLVSMFGTFHYFFNRLRGKPV